MDEADILADRKLIHNNGKIRCLGTSIYLKNHFNMKYNLNVETKDKEKINVLVKRFIPEAIYFENEELNEFESYNKFYTWRLPLNSSDGFASLLNELDKLSGSVINKYALSLPTLEELFVRLEDDITFNEDTNKDESNDKRCLIQTNENSLPKLKTISKPSKYKIISTLVKYRLKIFLKDKAFAFSAVLLPIILFTLTFYFINKFMFDERIVTYKSKEVTIPSMYFNTKINFASNSTLPLTTENIISGVSNKISGVSNDPVEKIKFPKFEDNYYLSSVGDEMDSATNTFKFNVFYNETMPHSIPATVNALSNAYLASKNINDRITINNHPWDNRKNNLTNIGLSFVGLMLCMSVVVILNKFGPLSARERINQLILQLQLNGVSRFNYWISSFITDNGIFLTTCVLLILAGVAIRFKPLLDLKIVLLIIGFLIVWSISTMLFQYILSFIFEKEDTAYSGITAINLIPIFIGFSGLILFNFISTTGSPLYVIVSLVFCLVLTALCPCFGIIALLNSLFTLKFYSISLSSDLTLNTIMDINNMISPLLILLVVLIFIYSFLLMILDCKKNQTNKSDVHELPQETLIIYEKDLEEGDDDVKREFEFVKEHRNNLPISTYHLCKEFNIPKNRVSNKSERDAIEKKNSNDYIYGDIHRSVVHQKNLLKQQSLMLTLVSETMNVLVF